MMKIKWSTLPWMDEKSLRRLSRRMFGTWGYEAQNDFGMLVKCWNKLPVMLRHIVWKIITFFSAKVTIIYGNTKAKYTVAHWVEPYAREEWFPITIEGVHRRILWNGMKGHCCVMTFKGVR